MMPNWRGGKMVTILRRQVTGQDELGNDVLGTVSSTQVTAVLVPLSTHIAPRASSGGSPSEELQGSFLVAAGYTAYFPPGTALTVTDHLLIDGETWRLSGVPGNFQSPFTGASGPVQAELVKVTG